MALIHNVQFSTAKQMVTEVAEIYMQFAPIDPLPTWWEKFVAWTEAEKVSDISALQKKLDDFEAKPDEAPEWWSFAVKAFKSAKSMKTITIKTDPYEIDEENDGEDDGEDSIAVDEDGEGEEPEGEEEGEGEGEEEGEGEADDNGKAGAKREKK